MVQLVPYSIEGSYYESCNCEAICPCRRQNGIPGKRSTYGICQFLLSWKIHSGKAGAVDLSGRSIVLAGFYDDDEKDSPWRVMLFVDNWADEPQFEALAAIFRGKLGGNISFLDKLFVVYDVRKAQVTLTHTEGSQSIQIAQGPSTLAMASVIRELDFDGTITCGIPGHDRPGRESVSTATISTDPLQWSYEAQCGFATSFHYSNG